MGIEWFYKASRGNDGYSGGKSMNIRKNKDKNTSSSSSGCMSVIFNVFDIQRHQFRFSRPFFMSESTSTMTNHQQSCIQGIEARRNSSESPESAMNVAPSQSKVEEETNLNLRVGRIQIKTKQSRLTDDLSSISPGTKTPNLVARLMGLNFLPESSSPRPSSSSPATALHRTRSLPATPRASTACRRLTDCNHYHHRLSLQINKENHNHFPADRKDENEEIKTQYAKQITNQVRERISRRLGTDVSNTIPHTRSSDRRRDSDLVLLKQKKAPVRLLNIKSNINKPISDSHVKSKSQIPNLRKSSAIKPEKRVKDEKIKRIASERYDLRLKKKLENDHGNGMNVKNTKTKILGFKKEMTSSFSTARSSLTKVSLHNSNSPNKPHNTNNLRSAATNVDGLIDGDTGRGLLAMAVETEEEGIVKDIENEIVENLVHEIATEARTDMVRSWPVLFT